MLRARTINEFREWIRQALEEIQDLRDAIDFDEEYIGDARELLEPLEDSLRALMQKAEGPSYVFGGGDLPFMTVVNVYDEAVLPVRPLLVCINQTHQYGLDEKIP
jgi:hypothetical protein